MLEALGVPLGIGTFGLPANHTLIIPDDRMTWGEDSEVAV
jgi:hypothetical protein